MSTPVFRYTAVDPSGKTVKGSIESTSEQLAYRQLVAQRLTPTRIVPSGGRAHAKGATGEARRRRARIRPDDIASVTHQLSVLVGARIPLVEAIRTISDHEPNARLSDVLREIARQVGGGRSLTESLAPHRRLFGDVYIQTIRAAEGSGNLISVLKRLAEATEEESDLRRAVKGALIYPITVLVALLLAMFFLLVFVVPRFGRMFAARGVDLPAMTRVLLGVGESVHSFWWAYLGVGAALVVLVMFLRKTDQGRDTLDRWLHRVPFVNQVLQSLAVARFASIFGLSLSSGVGLIDSLEAGGRASGRPMLIEDTRRLADSVRAGQRLAVALDGCSYLPGFAKQLIRAGEAAAELPVMCEVIAHHFAKRTRDLTKNSAKVVEPVLIAGLTGLVLVVAIAVFVPMWDMVVVVG
ncbi:MAG: type II secretion system F family protein [Phycisphaerales bacterium]